MAIRYTNGKFRDESTGRYVSKSRGLKSSIARAEFKKSQRKKRKPKKKVSRREPVEVSEIDTGEAFLETFGLFEEPFDFDVDYFAEVDEFDLDYFEELGIENLEEEDKES